jgi:hypothetical protein
MLCKSQKVQIFWDGGCTTCVPDTDTRIGSSAPLAAASDGGKRNCAYRQHTAFGHRG